MVCVGYILVYDTAWGSFLELQLAEGCNERVRVSRGRCEGEFLSL